MFGRAVLFLLGATLVSTVGAAQMTLPPPTDPAERAMLPEIGDLLGGGHATLPKLDAMLARLPKPTPLRGLVQFARGTVLDRMNRLAEAKSAAEEAVGLLPNVAEPKLLLSGLLTFTGEPRRAADLWPEASRQSTEAARTVDPYLLDALVGRLTDSGDAERANILRARMADIGVAGLLAAERSDTALAQVSQAGQRGDLDAARTALMAVTNPHDLLRLWTDKRFESFWPAIDDMGGPALARAQGTFAQAVRGDWQRERSLPAAVQYARLLQSANRYDAVVILFKPVLDQAGAREDDPNLWFLSTAVARSLEETGRVDDGRALLERFASRSDYAPYRLNATANLALLASREQRWNAAATLSENWIEAAKREGAKVNRSAILKVEAVGACALAKLGRSGDAAPLVGDLRLAQRAVPQTALDYDACMGDLVSARTMLVDALDNVETRPWALATVQPHKFSGNLAQEVAEGRFLDSLRQDPSVRAAAAAVGRILPAPIAVELPESFDPEAVDPAGKPSRNSV